MFVLNSVTIGLFLGTYPKYTLLNSSVVFVQARPALRSTLQSGYSFLKNLLFYSSSVFSATFKDSP